MARKYEIISKLAEETAKEVVKNETAWKRYLTTAARIYKYPFQEQLLIYAQRPDATACASIEVWNSRKLNCWVNKGAKGIALIDEENSYTRLKYVFDVSDVHKARRIGRDPYLWELKQEQEQSVMKRLEHIYGETDAEKSFGDRLLEIAESVTNDCYEEVAEDLLYLTDGSFLDGLDEYSLKVHLRETLRASISYTLLTRCGLDAEDYQDSMNFDFIHEFNTVPVLSQLGSNTTELCKPILMEIGKAIRVYEQEISKKEVDNTQNLRYNALKRKSETRKQNIEENKKENDREERGSVYGTDISEERRLLHPEYQDGRTAGGNADEVRYPAEGLSEGEQERSLFRASSERQIDEPPAGDSGDSRAEDGTADRADEPEPGRERGTERERTDEVGADEEQRPTVSGGDDSDRTDLPLEEKEEPEITPEYPEEPQFHIEPEKSDSDELPDFLSSEDENTLRGVLCFDEYMKNKRPDIAMKFVSEPDEAKRTAYIKESYNQDYSLFDVDGQRVGYKAEEDGLVVWAGNYLTRTSETKLSWDAVRELLDDYIRENVYLIPEEVKETEERGEPVYEQMNLFPSMAEQVGNISIDRADEVFSLAASNPITDEMIDYVLLSGGGQQNSRSRIYAKYQKGLDADTMAEFLKQEYGMGGKGFTFEGEPLCVWYDEEGMNFSRGNAARFRAPLKLSWKRVEDYTHELIVSGRYMEEAEVWHVPAQERMELASKIYFFFRDEYGTMPEEPELRMSSFPDSQQALAEMLSNPEGIDKILYHMDKAIGELDRGEVKARFRLIYKPKDIRTSVEELKREELSFPSAKKVEVPVETFITQDEIDYKLSRGSSMSGGLFRIYEFFLNNHNKKEQADFLKNEYGIGGSSPALVGAWHSYADYDGKGLRLSKGSIMEPTAKLLLTWTKVAERIRKLIDIDRFLTPKAKEAFAAWKAEKEQKALEKAKEKLQAEAEIPEETVQEPEIEQGQNDHRKVVALESTEDYTDYSIGFFTYHYQDGRQGIRYRLVTIEEDGHLEPYSKQSSFFINEAAAREYLSDHAEEIREIPYDELVHEAGKNLQAQKSEPEKEESENGKADVPEQEETAEINEEMVETEEVDTSEVEPLMPDFEVKPEVTVQKTEPGDRIDRTGAVNFHITDDALGAGTAKQKFERNIAAIETLQQIENEHRIATQEEQQILSGYVGWGGLSEAFDEKNGAWYNEYQKLKSLLSPEEYASARESTLNAHYTSPIIIRSIYDTLGRMGFEKGNILEPSIGIGNFFGMLPERMQDSRLYGVELDSLTGRIAKQLYPKAEIQISGFEKTNHPKDFFDVVVGNVPFGQYKVADKPYDKHNFLIHDYFLAKSLDKVRPGGIVAVVTSKGTMDKKSPAVRKYLAQRAELLGAVRLPNTAFKANAGTEVTSDILFFKKRDRVVDLEPDWVHLGENEDGIAMNQYFIEHPEMVAGKMELVSGPYGMEATCSPIEGKSLEEQLKEAMSHIQGEIENSGLDELEDDIEKATILADPSVKNFSYAVVDGEVYYRENSVMKPVEMTGTMQERIKGMVSLRDTVNDLIAYQLEEYGDTVIREKQAELSALYDEFTKKFGLINSQTNKRAFNQDSSYCLLCSLEVLNEDGTLKCKADMFTKRTIKRQETVTSVDTPFEALAVSMSEKACVDIRYMESLLGGSEHYERIVSELSGVIFKNPLSDPDDPYAGWENSDEYLSGKVREKLSIARLSAETNPEYAVNVAALERVQPKLLDASEIEVRLGATWVDPKYINDFMRQVFETPEWKMDKEVIGVQYSPVTGQWNIKGKNADSGNPLVEATYGTGRANAYKILEDSLNLRDCRIFDTVIEDGKEKRVLNKKETTLASQKQEAVREAYKDWIFQDADRREALCEKYNEIFNSNRPREFDGSHLTFPGMSPDITLRPHQKNAVAHQLYGDNTLLAHCVGAGKTYEMAAAAMESKRLGLAQKSLFVVPNHLTGQWASEFLQLYPGANILAATKKDFEPANRKKFCSRIATGDYDAVIIGHSQFEKIPLSRERQERIIEGQIDEIEMAIETAKAENGERYTIKQMEKTKKSLQTRLERLNDTSRKDDVVTFEQLGVDRLFVDESHNYKNLFLYTKMRNVAGIAQTEAQKSSDMFAKCQYMDELTGGKGVTFATGTPISNSMTELYTNMRYLQYGTLQRMGLGHFDSWAASFGETITAIELAPEGTGYRAKTRFAKFFNLPELISVFKESADIQTPDMLKLPVPEAVYEDVVLKPSEYQQEMVESLADRAQAVRDRLVDPSQDNMLRITNDGRKLALDQRLVNPMLPDNEDSKVNACVEKALDIWKETAEQKSTQLIFCDLSTPKAVGKAKAEINGKEEDAEVFDDVYHDIKRKLMAKGVPEEEIAFIHEANTEIRKAELFAKVRSGQVRFLLGSTAKMGAGTNVQDKLIALHHLDVPWRPSDIEQQEGRILRQGNENPKVRIFRYITEGTFDAYSWQLIENKQKFIGQIMTSKSPVRSCEDVDEAALSYAEVKALATGNPYIKEKMDLDIQVSKLKLLKANHTSQIYRLEDNIAKNYPKKISAAKEMIAAYEIDLAHYKEVKPADKESFAMKLGDRIYTDKKEAGTALISFCRQVKTPNVATPIGEYLGFKMNVTFDSFYQKFTVNLKGALSHNVEIGTDVFGNLTRIGNALDAMEKELQKEKEELNNTQKQLENAKEEVKKPFAQELELNEKLDRLSELNALLNMDEKGAEDCLEEQEEADTSLSGKEDARTSIMEKLAQFKEQSSQMGIGNNKNREKAASL